MQIERARFPSAMGGRWAEVRGDSPLIIDNLWDDAPRGQGVPGVGAAGDDVAVRVRALAAAGAAEGARSVDRRVGRSTASGPGQFEPRAAQLAWALANQAAVAIENARLYDQGRELAAFEERQRLARELHDSVTQSLYAASMLGLALPTGLGHAIRIRGRQMLAHLRDVSEPARWPSCARCSIELRPSVALQVESSASCCASWPARWRSRIELPDRPSTVEGTAVAAGPRCR